MIKLNKEIEKNMSKNKYYSIEQFEKDCISYTEAVKENRILYDVVSVSNSGMSRKIKIRAFIWDKEKKEGYYRQYNAMLEILGYKTNKDYTTTIKNCGMNMIFYTNYTIINKMHKMGLIDKNECDMLSQKVNY